MPQVKCKNCQRIIETVAQVNNRVVKISGPVKLSATCPYCGHTDYY